MHQFDLTSNGTWEGTTFTNHGANVEVAEVFLQISCGRDELGTPMLGGVTCGGEMAAYLRLSNNPGVQHPLFPGEIRLCLPGGELVIQGQLGMDLPSLGIFFNGVDVTQHILDLQVQLDIDQNVMGGTVSLYKADWLGLDEILTYPLFS
jgi:hypothetical protein